MKKKFKLVNSTYRSKLGFTLIELLAVIVIIAIIALIATPIVMNIIEDVKASSAERSAENYIRALQLKISSNLMNHEKVVDDCYKIGDFEVDVKGKIPTNGIFCVKGEKIDSYYLTMDKYNIQNNGDKANVTDKNVLSFYPEMTIDYFESANDFHIAGASLNYKRGLTLSYYVETSLLDNYDSFYIEVNNSMAKETARKLIKIGNYKKTDKYYIFDYSDADLTEFNSPEAVRLVAVKNNIETRSDIFNYNIVNYADHIINKTKNQKEKDILIAMIKFGTAAQLYFNYNTADLAYNILDEDNRKFSDLSSEAAELLNNVPELDDAIPNSSQYLIDNNLAYLQTFGINYKNLISMSFDIKKSNSSTISSEESSKYGVLIFLEDEYNELMKGKNSYDSLNIKNVKQEFSFNAFASNIIRYYYCVNFKDFTKPIYFRSYYHGGNNYYYSSVKVYSVIKIYKEFIESSSNTNLLNVSKSFLNFIALTQ